MQSCDVKMGDGKLIGPIIYLLRPVELCLRLCPVSKIIDNAVVVDWLVPFRLNASILSEFQFRGGAGLLESKKHWTDAPGRPTNLRALLPSPSPSLAVLFHFAAVYRTSWQGLHKASTLHEAQLFQQLQVIYFIGFWLIVIGRAEIRQQSWIKIADGRSTFEITCDLTCRNHFQSAKRFAGGKKFQVKNFKNYIKKRINSAQR